MSYRLQEPKPKKPIRTLQDTSTPMHFFILEGTQSEFAIPCWYVETKWPTKAFPHNWQLHDYFGWPAPDHPDHICQHWHWSKRCCTKGHKHCHRDCRDYLDMAKVFPIFLRQEGYDDDITVRLAGLRNWDAANLVITSSIDQKDEWVIRIYVDARTIQCNGQRQDARVALYANRENHTDPVTIGLLTFLPALPGVEGDTDGLQ